MEFNLMSRKTMVIFIFGMVGSFGGMLNSALALGDDAAIVQIKPVVELEGAQTDVTLGDIMVARGLSARAVDQLKSVRLADAPKSGESRSFTDVGLGEIFAPFIRDIQNKTGEKIALRIPSRVTISRRKFQLRSADVEKELILQFKRQCSDCQIEIANLVMPAMGPVSSEVNEWNVHLNAELPRGSFSLPIQVHMVDGTKRTFWISGNVTIRRNVLVTSRALASGEHLQPQDYVLTQKDVTFATDLPAGENDVVSGVTARALAAGETIWRSGMRKELAIHTGDGVKVMTGTDSWQISIEGVSQGQGYVGDVIRVKIPRTQRIVSGTLKEKGVVEVQ
jgi:flagella basal body P-ring formation protein FlgA